jgi:hypothetical protein
MEIKFDVAQISTLNLAPNDVLMVKLVGGPEDFTSSDMDDLRTVLKNAFKGNEVMVFCVPSGTDIVFEKVEQPSQDLGCSSAPKGYCEDCNCGKKESLDGQ